MEIQNWSHSVPLVLLLQKLEDRKGTVGIQSVIHFSQQLLFEMLFAIINVSRLRLRYTEKCL